MILLDPFKMWLDPLHRAPADINRGRFEILWDSFVIPPRHRRA